MNKCSADGCRKPTYSRGLCCAHYKRALKERPPSAIRPRTKAATADAETLTRLTVTELLAELAAAMPELPGARCKGRAELFDATIIGVRGAPPEDVEHARATAAALCAQCPALHACRRWLDNQPPDTRPLGIIAGQLNTRRL